MINDDRVVAGAGFPTHPHRDMEIISYNPSKESETRLLQIWVLPEVRGLKPGYEQRRFPMEERENRLRLIVSRDGREGSITVHQDIALYASVLEQGAALDFAVPADRHAWLQVVSGGLTVNREPLEEGDGLRVSDTEMLKLESEMGAEILLFDLA